MRISFFAYVVCVLFSCKQPASVYTDNNCKLVPPFVSRLGFNVKNAYFSTSEKRTMGLVLLEASDPQKMTAGAAKAYQDSSWKKAGWLAPIQLDNRGNVFTAPAPFINVINNPVTDQNTIYKVDGQTGIMAAFTQLPRPNNDSLGDQNPYGIIGMAYLCDNASLYVSSIAGSNRSNEKGCIYQVDAANGEIKDKLTGMDILGMGISNATGENRLFFGKARTPEVYSVALANNGGFSGQPKWEFSLTGLGPRGDDKVRRIRTGKDGSLEVFGMEFNFNLIAPTEKQESVYRFVYDGAGKKWRQTTSAANEQQ